MMQKFLAITLLFFFISAAQDVFGQDPQFSQFYANPLYLNPAFTGAHQQSSFGANFRDQWPAINANFVTYAAYMDHYWEKYYSGVGFSLMHDREGLGGLTSTSASAYYSYELYLNDRMVFKPGVQLGVVSKSADFNKMVFGSQFNPATGDFDPSIPSGEVIGDKRTYFDLGLGGLLYGTNFWVGVSASHLTQPNESFYNEEVSRLPMKISVHGGYRYDFPTNRYTSNEARERSLTPTAQYKVQGDFSQLDVGFYATFEPLVLGIWYRGIPVKNDDGLYKNESLVLLAGFTQNDWKIGYSFDFTLSELGIQSGGAHEVSFTYLFRLQKERYRPPRNVMRVPCPSF